MSDVWTFCNEMNIADRPVLTGCTFRRCVTRAARRRRSHVIAAAAMSVHGSKLHATAWRLRQTGSRQVNETVLLLSPDVSCIRVSEYSPPQRAMSFVGRRSFFLFVLSPMPIDYMQSVLRRPHFTTGVYKAGYNTNVRLSVYLSVCLSRP